MATYYWRGLTGSTWGTAGNWSTGSTSTLGGVVPTVADDLIFDANSSDGILARKESNSGAEEERQLLHKKYMDTMPLGGAVKPVSGLG